MIKLQSCNQLVVDSYIHNTSFKALNENALVYVISKLTKKSYVTHNVYQCLFCNKDGRIMNEWSTENLLHDSALMLITLVNLLGSNEKIEQLWSGI